VEDQEFILAEIMEAFLLAPKKGFPQLRSYRLEVVTLTHVCVNRESGQWLIQAITGQKMREGTMLKAMNKKDLPKPVKWSSELKTNIF
jgi:hypothetical protein